MNLTLKKIFTFGLLLTIGVTAPRAVKAQLNDRDPFGESDDSGIPPAPRPGSVIDSATTDLFGTGGHLGTGGSGMFPGTGQPGPVNQQNTTPPPPEAWSNFSELPGGERIEDTYEIKMREELAKPLPKRKPFGGDDPLQDLQNRMTPKKP